MQTLLDSRAKTVPSNYKVLGFISEVPGSEEPGYSLTDEQWNKAKRQEDPNYDWYAYQQCVQKALFDHPEFAHREHEAAVQHEWDDILADLEPYNPRSI